MVYLSIYTAIYGRARIGMQVLPHPMPLYLGWMFIFRKYTGRPQSSRRSKEQAHQTSHRCTTRAVLLRVSSHPLYRANGRRTTCSRKSTISQLITPQSLSGGQRDPDQIDSRIVNYHCCCCPTSTAARKACVNLVRTSIKNLPVIRPYSFCIPYSGS